MPKRLLGKLATILMQKMLLTRQRRNCSKLSPALLLVGEDNSTDVLAATLVTGVSELSYRQIVVLLISLSLGLSANQ